MKNVNKFGASLLVSAMVLLFVSKAGAQSQAANQAEPVKAKTEAATTVQSQGSLFDQMKNFQSDPANPELSGAKYALLKARYYLENNGQTKLSATELASIRESIPALEKKVADLESMNKTNSPK